MTNFNDYKKIIDTRGQLFAFNKIQKFDAKRLYLIEPEINVWRGKHFHKDCTQLILVFNGELTCKILDSSTGLIDEFILSAGSSFLQKPGLAFCFKSNLKDTKLLVMSDKEFDKNDYYEVALND